MSNGIYIYGIIQASDPQEFGNIGIGDQPSSVQTLEYQDIAAVVSASPVTAYDSLAKEKTIKDLITHQVVVEKVMQRFTTLPVKFGTTVDTGEDVIKFLRKGYSFLHDELRKLEKKIELDVVATWDLQKVLAQVYRHDSRISTKQQEIALKGDKANIEDKIMLGKFIEQALKAEKARYSELILQALREWAVDVCLHDLAGEEMIFNSAFLLEKQDEQRFNQAVADLDQELENAVNFRVVGPLPAYSFATILLERIDPSRFEEAKKIFGLNGEITDKAVRDTYRQLARTSHPDKKSEGNAKSFQEINAAYKTLKNYTEKGLVHVAMHRWEQDS